ncbi:hypothetical protein B0T13DRAFT_497643 [Neurospora crassa]|nr:hypothetical protein B0T13DRAFT_497643 [Neurospora crassa]
MPGGLREGDFKDPRVFSESDKKRLVDAELAVPPPYQISKGETISCVTVVKMLKPNSEHWRADESFVSLTIDNPEEENNWNLVTRDQQHQPSEWRFRVFVRTQYILSPNPHTEEIELDPIILPDELWPGGKPDVPQKPIYVAGIFQLRESLEVKEEAGVKRQNPLSPEQQSIVARLAAIQVQPFPPPQAN